MAPRISKATLPKRRQLLKALDEAGRRIGAQTVLVSDLVATRVGLNSTDLECLDLLLLAGPTTAGGLAAYTGLTSGATTAAIDRLEHAGFVARRRNANDRRKVLVEVVEAGINLILPFYDPMMERIDNVHARYDDRQLKTVLRFLNDALEATAEHVAWLQTQPVVSRGRCRHPMTGLASPATPRPARRAPTKARRPSRARNQL